MPRTAVIIPTYNEALNIEGLVRQLIELSDDFDAWIVDDASPDGTGDIVSGLHGAFGHRVKLVGQSRKGGRGAAVLAGLRVASATGRYVIYVEMDADFSHLPDELTRLVQAGRHAEVVIGSRYLPGSSIVGWSRRRRIWSRISNRLIHLVLRLPITDYTNGYRLYSHRAVKTLLAASLHERGYISLSEWALVLHRAGFTFADVPTTFVNRRLGTSKMSLSEAAGALRALVRLRGSRVNR